MDGSFFLMLGLGFLMLGIGLSISFNELLHSARTPKPILVGIISQMLIIPLVTLGIIYFFNPAPEIAIGLLLIAACPGGAGSNFISYILKADVSLSIILTGFINLIGTITTPLYIGLSTQFIFGQYSSLEFNFWNTAYEIFLFTGLPLMTGMYIKHKFETLSRRIEKKFKYGAGTLLLVLILFMSHKFWNNIAESAADILICCLLLNVATFSAGFLIARFFKLPLKQRFTIAIETGFQNSSVAIIIATGILNQPEWATPGLVYGYIMVLSAFVLVGTINFYNNKVGTKVNGTLLGNETSCTK